MARTSYQRPPDERAVQAALEEAEAKTDLTRAQAEALRQGTVLDQRKLDLAAREIADKMTLGKGELAAKGEDVSQRDRASRLVAAMTLLGYNEKLQTESLSGQQALLSDLAKRPDIPPAVLGQAFKAAGYPALQTSLDAATQKQREAFVQQQVEPMRSPKIRSDEERDKKFRAMMEQAYPGSYEEARALAFPKAGQVRPTPTPTPQVAPAPGADVVASNQRLVDTLLKAAGMGETTGAAAQPTIRAPARVFGGRVVNQPPGTEGMDLNVNTGEWIPQGREGTINGLPASEAIAQGFTRNLLAGRRAQAPETEGARARLGMYPENQLPTGQAYAGTPQPTREPLVNQNLVQGIPKPAGAGELVPPPPIPPIEQLLAAAAPGGAPTPTPAPIQTPTPAPPMSDAEARRQEEIRRMLEEEARRRAAMAQQQQGY